MSKQLNTIIKECRELLEKEIAAQTAMLSTLNLPADRFERQIRDSALAVLLEISILRCFQENLSIPSPSISATTSFDELRIVLEDLRQYLKRELCVPFTHADLAGFSLSPSTLKTLLYHFTHSISSDKWRSDHVLGWIYHAFQDETAEQKQHGRFYTPESVAETIVAQVFEAYISGQKDTGERAKEQFGGTILDLGCGCGAFALQAFEQIYDWYQQLVDGPHLDIPQQILARHLFLVDNDSWACQIAALSLYLKAKRLESDCHIDTMNIACGDALQRWENIYPEYSRRGVLAPGIERLNHIFRQKYDMIIGNPPYIVINQLRTPKEVVRLYKSYASAAYKINTFPLFIERGIDLLHPQGILGMVVPNTLLTQMYFEPLRRYMLHTSKILRILDTKRLFDNAFVENCILLLQREADARKRTRNRIECITQTNHGKKRTRNHAQQEFLPLQTTSYIVQQHFEHAPFMMFRVHMDEALFALVEHLADDAPKLGDLCESHDGVNPGNAKSKLIVPEKLDDTCRKVLNGKNIGRYRLEWGGLYVRYDRTILTKDDNVRWGDQKALDSAKILTRQTADRIIGTFDGGQYYATNSIHTTVLKEEYHALSLQYILALLNSKVLSFYYRKLFPEAGQVFSQVKLINLRQLPLRIVSTEVQQKIVRLVDQLLKTQVEQENRTLSEDNGRLSEHAAARCLKQAIDQRETRACTIRELDDQLDALVFTIYQLAPEQIHVIRDELGESVCLFPKMSLDEASRKISHASFHQLYCHYQQTIFQIAEHYRIHPESLLALRKEYGIYRSREF